ncbi:MAG: M15 family metallopeptidase [Aureispira sp.]
MFKLAFFCWLIWGLGACVSDQATLPVALPTTTTLPSDSNSIPKVDSIPLGLQQFIEAYPEQHLQAKGQQLIWPDSFSLVYADSSTWPSFWDSLERPTLALQVAQSYPKGEEYSLPQRNQDPGRIRVNAFFEKMYGDNKAAVQAKLVSVDFLGTPVRITTVNGVHKRLAAVAKALEKHPEWHRYCLPTAGTFNWRPIAGTSRMSSHSFGIAIDLNVKWANYWRWAVAPKEGTGPRPILYKNRLPLGLVALFEQEGFIWGGKWYHYDTMHFEYRPELLQ